MQTEFEQLKNYLDGKSLSHKQQRGLVIWKDMLENALSGVASWRTKK